jgi:membrane protease YdiL (CAAX protease family)
MSASVRDMLDAQAGLSTLFVSVLLALAFAVGLGEFYSYMVQGLHVKPWQAGLLAHISIGILVYLIRKPARVGFLLRGTPLVAWLPGPLILLGAYVLSLWGRQPMQAPAYSLTGSSEAIYILASLTLIPLAEEMVFRMGLTPFLSRFAGDRWGPWYSAMVFSVAHTHPTWDRVLGLKIGLPIGPFILAICCDIIVRRWRRVWPAALFHSCCNATVYVFAWLNPSWVSKLNGLYM